MKMTEKLQYFSGMLLLSLGIVILTISNFGVSPWDSVFLGLTYKFGLTQGSWIFIVGVILVIISAILKNERVSIGSMIAGFFVGLFVDFFIFLLPSEINVLFGFLGIVFMGLGIVMYTRTSLPPGPVDYFMLTLSSVFKISMSKSKLIMDSFAIGIGILLGGIATGTITIGTLIIYLLLPFFIKKFNQIFDNLAK